MFRSVARAFYVNSRRVNVFSITMKSAASSKVESSAQMDKPQEFDKLIYIDKTPYTIVTEGKAEVLFPSSHDVFYNPVQEFNRDLSIAILKQFINETIKEEDSKKASKSSSDGGLPEIKVLEALAASGLRSIRFAKEIPNVKKVVANDRDTQAYLSIQRNIKHNKVEDIIEACNEDASLVMYKNRQYKNRFAVVDLDPYGTAAPFLDAAVQCVTEGGLLMITCTDMAILCGNGSEACHAKYGAVSMKTGNCHEMALRIVLQSIESHANRYGRYIEPLLSLSVDFYVRVFVRVYTSPIIVKQSVCKLAMVYVCSECGSFHLQQLGNRVKTEKGEKYSAGVGPPVNMKCNICDGSHKVGGPIWAEKLHNKEFIQKTIQLVEGEQECYNTSKRMLGMLNVVLEELDDCPLFHRIEKLSSILHVATPTNKQIRSAILNAGYRVSMSHTVPTSIKTDAPQEVIWSIIKTWAKQNAGKKTFEENLSKRIMSKNPSIDVSFEPHPDADPQSRSNHLLRFQINPAPNWGPKCRATTSLLSTKQEEKRINRQNKRQRKSEKETNDDTLPKKVKSEDTG
ncbi:tRNA (guanine(26)-N(2))-dimethyltransferase, partial [Stegodyphus mimosarum]